LANAYTLAINDPKGNTSALLNEAATYEKSLNLSSSIIYVQNLMALAIKSIPLVAQDRLDFYNFHVISQIGTHLQGLLSLSSVIASARAFAQKDIQLAETFMNTAIEEVEELFSYQRLAEYGRWRGFFKNDVLSGFPVSRTQLVNVLNLLSGLPAVGVPYNQYYDWYDYQANNYYPYIYDSTYYMDFVVHIQCITTGCINTPIGGNISQPTQLLLSVPRKGLVIRYTLNDTSPTSNSMLYTSPVTIHNNTIVTAAAFGANIPTYLPTRTSWYYNPPTRNDDDHHHKLSNVKLS
jgi:hypothetical protein